MGLDFLGIFLATGFVAAGYFLGRDHGIQKERFRHYERERREEAERNESLFT